MHLMVISQGKSSTTTCLNHPSDQDECLPWLFSLFELSKIMKNTSVSDNSENIHLSESSNATCERFVQIKVKGTIKKNPMVNFPFYSGTN